MAAESKSFISDGLSKRAGESIECPSSNWGTWAEKSSAHFLSLFEVGLVLSFISGDMDSVRDTEQALHRFGNHRRRDSLVTETLLCE